MNNDNALKRAVDILGGQGATARALGVATPTVAQWLKQIRPIPIARCVQIERETSGAVTREELRPDIDWHALAAPAAVSAAPAGVATERRTSVRRVEDRELMRAADETAAKAGVIKNRKRTS